MADQFAKVLDTNGDGTGFKNANFLVDETDFPNGAIFTFYPSANQIMEAARLMVAITDTGVPSADAYGAAGALTTGITVRHMRGPDVITDYCDGVTIKTNGCWGRIAYDMNIFEPTAGEALILVRLSFFKFAGSQGDKSGLLLNGNLNERIEVVVPAGDDLSDLVNQYFVLEGEYRRK